MTSLNRELFKKTLQVITLTVKEPDVGGVIKLLKKHLICIRNFKNVRTFENGKRMLLLDPQTYLDINSAQDVMFSSGIAEKVKYQIYLNFIFS